MPVPRPWSGSPCPTSPAAPASSVRCRRPRRTRTARPVCRRTATAPLSVRRGPGGALVDNPFPEQQFRQPAPGTLSRGRLPGPAPGHGRLPDPPTGSPPPAAHRAAPNVRSTHSLACLLRTSRGLGLCVKVFWGHRFWTGRGRLVVRPAASVKVGMPRLVAVSRRVVIWSIWASLSLAPVIAGYATRAQGAVERSPRSARTAHPTVDLALHRASRKARAGPAQLVGVDPAAWHPRPVPSWRPVTVIHSDGARPSTPGALRMRCVTHSWWCEPRPGGLLSAHVIARSGFVGAAAITPFSPGCI